MGLTIGEAAQQTGKSKSTLSRAIKQGKISASRNDDGSFSIAESELFRVYKRVWNATVETAIKSQNDADATPHATPEKDIEILTLRVELRAAQEKIDDLKQQTDDIREDRDHWRQQANRLLAAPQTTQQAEQKKGFWDRLRGK
jgi:excisionase family DNA binding protein